MGRSRVSGPWAGAYTVHTFSVATWSGTVVSTGPANEVGYSWTIPAGMDIIIVNAQVRADVVSGASNRVNLLVGGASILQNDDNSATARGIQLTQNGNITATLSNGTFGSASTSIIAPTTPSLPLDVVKPTYGVYAPGGATLAATVFSGAAANNVQSVMFTLLYYPISHPDVTKSAFE